MKKQQRIASALAAVVTMLVAATASASPYLQTNLVSDVPGLAQITDPNLKNPWGISFSPTSPFWTSNQATNTSTLYSVSAAGVVTQSARVVAIPTTATPAQGPTGQVFNNTTAFPVGAGLASFIFADLNGTISAWNAAIGNTAQIVATTPGAIYTGLAISNVGGVPRLYAANNSQNRVDVFDGAFNLISTTSFVNDDPRLAGLVPFNVQTIGSTVYVTYAPIGRTAQTQAKEGTGAVAIFDTGGNLLQTLIAGSKLASPWGVALAPTTFGGFGGDLLIGNFSFAVAEINAFDPLTGAYLGTIADQAGNALINAGLWGLAFGNGVAGNANTLYFTAGINNEVDGLFGSISAIPEPDLVMLIAVGLCAMAIRRRRAVGRVTAA